ncbi:MAG: hypothetical protein JO111_14930 [Caulobacteraceae bacterium]|nr:hypothetical protein [Caulobacteraceae bacterium]
MRVFLDFEASSLATDSYPIEVGWVMEDGSSEEHLIRPAPAWTDWDPQAEAIHGLTREVLVARGEPHGEVAGRMMRVLAGHELFASAPSWDGKWLSVLLRAAGYPRHALRLRDTEVADMAAAEEILSPGRDPTEAAAEAAQITHTVRERLASPPVHRALPDARWEFEAWQEIRRVAWSARDASVLSGSSSLLSGNASE